MEPEVRERHHGGPNPDGGTSGPSSGGPPHGAFQDGNDPTATAARGRGQESPPVPGRGTRSFDFINYNVFPKTFIFLILQLLYINYNGIVVYTIR